VTQFDVRKIRWQMDLSQVRFAEELGITQPTLCKIEKGDCAIEKYEDKIKKVFSSWKENKIKTLEQEIEYIKSL